MFADGVKLNGNAPPPGPWRAMRWVTVVTKYHHLVTLVHVFNNSIWQHNMTLPLSLHEVNSPSSEEVTVRACYVHFNSCMH